MEYEIVGGDGACYGDMIGPVRGTEVAVVNVKGWDYGKYMVIAIEKDIVIEGHKVKYLLIKPRYVGDEISDIRNRMCTVGIGIIKDPIEFPVAQVPKECVEYVAVGQVTPIKGA